MNSIDRQIAEELGVRSEQVEAAIRLLDEGATVPFIARYRKEVTGALDDVQLRRLEDRLGYLRELEERRAAVLKSIEEQGKLSPELARHIRAADTKTRLEDLYLPYKPKRRTRAMVARERGLERVDGGEVQRGGFAGDVDAAAGEDRVVRVGMAHRCLAGRTGRSQGRGLPVW